MIPKKPKPKVENCRLGCVTGGLVPILVEKMSSPSTKVALQACRALGNICYEHVSLSDGGRVSVMESGGAGQLLGLLQRAAQLSDSPEDHQLRLVATGFLLNLLNSYETMQATFNSLLSTSGTTQAHLWCNHLEPGYHGDMKVTLNHNGKWQSNRVIRGDIRTYVWTFVGSHAHLPMHYAIASLYNTR
ncbi:Rap1 GTPase-GDP dissociation stimulator 1 [Portunus trituberculatus]|uniref:Rap1 GTPase-GDP dissociation stimulator 1 n=1 Tax=Portunus trituberculatus TaxID=210409 RepID=A0A5B7DEN8_PORTR|nr:Rap1 GTPase-GDP dissociation stimulator 1 [Portunus trituberculatus]